MGIYVIAHRVNDATKLRRALKWGANAYEIDVTRKSSGYKAWHGSEAIDWNSANLEPHLDMITTALRTVAGRRVSLLIVDLKYNQNQKIREEHINEVRNLVQTRVLDVINGPNPNPRRGLFALYCVTKLTERRMCRAIATQGLGSHEGINFDAWANSNANRTNPRTARDWRDDNEITNFMYSTGITSTYHSKRAKRYAREAHALSLADPSRRLSTYAWTFNRANNASIWMRDHGHDGLMGNMARNFGHIPGHMSFYGLGDESLTTRTMRPPFLD